jgi:hypothetical protein
MISEHLERVTGKALHQAEKILDMETPEPTDEAFGPVLRAKTATIGTVLTTQTKVDENSLRKRGQDMMPTLLQIIRKHEKDNPVHLKVIEGGKA